MLDRLRVLWTEALDERGPCPECESLRVWHNGIRLRKASFLDGDQVIFAPDVPVRRLKCGVCKMRWCRPADRVVERAHHQPCVVAAAVTRVALEPTPLATIAREHGCHRRTVARWVERVAALAEPADLAREVVAESEAPVLPSPGDAAPRSRAPRVALVAAKALWILALLEALASLRGFEPPALMYASSLVPASAPTTSGSGAHALSRERDPTCTR